MAVSILTQCACGAKRRPPASQSPIPSPEPEHAPAAPWRALLALVLSVIIIVLGIS